MKSYSIFSILSFAISLIGSFLFFMMLTPIGLNSPLSEISLLEISNIYIFPFIIIPSLILLTIFFGRLGIIDIKKRGLKGRILVIMGITLIALPSLYYIFFILLSPIRLIK